LLKESLAIEGIRYRGGGGGFADYALASLHRLRIYRNTSYRMTIDLLKEMPQITGKIGLNAADLSTPSTLCMALTGSV
jgi:IS5 family transposase